MNTHQRGDVSWSIHIMGYCEIIRKNELEHCKLPWQTGKGADVGQKIQKKTNTACNTPACLLRQLCEPCVRLDEQIRTDQQGCSWYVFKRKKASCQGIKYEKHQIKKIKKNTNIRVSSSNSLNPLVECGLNKGTNFWKYYRVVLSKYQNQGPRVWGQDAHARRGGERGGEVNDSIKMLCRQV